MKYVCVVKQHQRATKLHVWDNWLLNQTYQINYLLGIVHPILVKKSYCDYFTCLHSSNQKCILFFLQSSEGMQISFPPWLPSVPFSMAAEDSPATFPPCRALWTGVTPKPWVFQEGKAMLCASQSVCTPASCARMDPWAHISSNELEELREAVDFISIGSLTVTANKKAPPNGTSHLKSDPDCRWQFPTPTPH